MELLQTLTYIGFNRRSDRTALEHRFMFNDKELVLLGADPAGLRDRVVAELENSGVAIETPSPLSEQMPEAAPEIYAHLLAGISLSLQYATGHLVDYYQVIPATKPGQISVVVEFEASDVGMRASQLAMQLLTNLLPGLEYPQDEEETEEAFHEHLKAFIHFSRALVLPRDTQAIIDAAKRRGVPAVKLERDPYEGLQGDFRVRSNGLLKLGHSCHQHIVDGTFCVDRSEHLMPLLRNREQATGTLHQLRAPLPGHDESFHPCLSANRAVRRARRIGYPVVVKPVIRSRGQGVTLNVRDEAGLRTAFGHAQEISQQVTVEGFVEGRTWQVVVAGHEVIALIDETRVGAIEEINELTRSLAQHISRQLDVGLLVLTIVTTDITRPLAETAGAIVDMDLAPELDGIEGLTPTLVARTMDHFLRWLYPDGAKSRIPLIAITGTNGKTTTSMMTMRILQTAGFTTGFAGSNGIYVNAERLKVGDRAGTRGHHRVLESQEVNFGVLETARGGITHSGFMYDHSNIAACLNVDDDHLGEFDIDTLDQMAQVKLSVLQRATDAVVLNADDRRCLQMRPALPGRRLALISLQRSLALLREIAAEQDLVCGLESHDGEDWLVIEERGKRLLVIAAGDIPATFEGRARVNISNALHAAAVCYLAGIEISHIQKALSVFDSSFENIPGRLNFFHGLPFTVVMDYAHNVDGFAELSRFLNQVDVSGRRIMCFSASGNRSDQFVADCARAVSAHFDHFLCRDHLTEYDREPGEVARLLYDALLADGVPETAVELVHDPATALTDLLSMGRPGDLLAYATGTKDMETARETITSFGNQ
jgi:UDP-N-acetylmuramyl tripeptide synthase